MPERSMLKSDLINILVVKRGVTQKQAESTIETIFESMKDALCRGENIEIRGLGAFHVKHYEGYQGRNPKTGEVIPVKPKRGIPVRTGQGAARSREPDRGRVPVDDDDDKDDSGGGSGTPPGRRGWRVVDVLLGAAQATAIATLSGAASPCVRSSRPTGRTRAREVAPRTTAPASGETAPR